MRRTGKKTFSLYKSAADYGQNISVEEQKRYRYAAEQGYDRNVFKKRNGTDNSQKYRYIKTGRKVGMHTGKQGIYRLRRQCADCGKQRRLATVEVKMPYGESFLSCIQNIHRVRKFKRGVYAATTYVFGREENIRRQIQSLQKSMRCMSRMCSQTDFSAPRYNKDGDAAWSYRKRNNGGICVGRCIKKARGGFRRKQFFGQEGGIARRHL